MLEKLKELVDTYAMNKSELDSYKELCDKENKEIKAIMKENDLTSFDTDNYTAKVSTQERTKFDEDKAIMLIQNLYLNKQLSKEALDRIIVQKPCINMDALENAIYHGDIDASTLSPANTVTQVSTLKVSVRKE